MNDARELHIWHNGHRRDGSCCTSSSNQIEKMVEDFALEDFPPASGTEMGTNGNGDIVKRK